MAQKQSQLPAAFQSMAFPRRRQTLHPWVCLSSQEGGDMAAEFSLGAPSADPRGRTGGAHPAAPLCAHSPGHASPRCGVDPGGGALWPALVISGGLVSCQRSGSRARWQGRVGLPVSRSPAPCLGASTGPWAGGPRFCRLVVTPPGGVQAEAQGWVRSSTLGTAILSLTRHCPHPLPCP